MPSPSHQEAYTSLSLMHQKADRSKKNHNPAALEQKPHHRKLTRMKKQRVMFQMKGLDKTPLKNN